MEENAISEGIKSLFESLNITQPKVRLNVHRHLVTVRFLKLPSTDEEEIAKIVKIESLKHIPYADENIIYGYKIIEKREDGYSNVLLAIAQANTINGFIEMLNEAHLETESISLGAEGLFLWYILTAEDREKEDAMLVNIDSGHIDIDVVREGKLVFTRGVIYDAKDVSATEKIVDQIKVSLAAYHKESPKGVDKIILTGTSDKAKECEGALKEISKTPVAIIDQMENLPISEDAHMELNDASFVELFGLSLTPEDIKINLMPEGLLEEDRVNRSKKNITVTLTLMLLTITIIFGLVMKKLHDKAVVLSYINRELSKIEPRVTKARKMMKDIDVIGKELERKPLAIDILREVYKATPPGISLNVLDFESNNTLTIRGTAPALSEIFKYVTALEGSPYLDNVKVKYATKRVVEDRELADFEINSRLSQIR